MKFSFSFQLRLKERLLEQQVEEYLLWKEERTTVCTDREHLMFFLKACAKDCIESVVIEDISAFKDAMREIRTDYMLNNAVKAVRCLFRYHKARKVECLNPVLIYAEKIPRLQTASEYATLYGMEKTKAKMGRPLNVERILKVKRLRDEGINGVPLSFRRIANLMRRNVSLIHYWYYFPLEERLKGRKESRF